MFTSSQIADRIKEAAHAKGVLVKDLLVVCKLSKNTLSTMKSGGSFPRLEAITAIADELNCSVDYLLGRTDDPAVKRMNLTDDERQKVTDYLQFILSQRK